MVDALKEVDTTEVLPLAHPLHMSQRLRADEPTEKNQRDLFQANAETSTGPVHRSQGDRIMLRPPLPADVTSGTGGTAWID